MKSMKLAKQSFTTRTFIDLAFQMGPMQGLTAEEVKQYVDLLVIED